MADQPPGRLLLRYSAPAMVGMVSASLYNAADAVFVGQGAGNLALAALTVAFPIQMLIMAVAQTVGVGSASLISRCLGENDRDKALRVAGSSFVSVTILGVLFTVLGFVFTDPLLILFGASPAVMEPARSYVQIVLIGSPLFCFAVSSNGIVRAEGNVKVAMGSMVLGTLINLVFDPILILGFGMGIRGAAIATVLGNIGSFLWLVWYFASRRGILRLDWAHLRPDWESMPEVFAIGASSFARNVAGSVYTIVVNNAVVWYGTERHLAILGVSSRIMMLALMPLFGLVQGLQPIAGFNFGAHHWERVRVALSTALRWATIWSAVCWVLIVVWAPTIIGWFDPTGVLVEEGAAVLRILLVMLPVVGFQVVGASFFQHIGKAWPALVLSTSRQILFLIPLILLLPLAMGLDGVWFAFPIADGLAFVFTLAWLVPEVRRLAARRDLESRS
jgi:putative MATE family efflux protein